MGLCVGMNHGVRVKGVQARLCPRAPIGKGAVTVVGEAGVCRGGVDSRTSNLTTVPIHPPHCAPAQSPFTDACIHPCGLGSSEWVGGVDRFEILAVGVGVRGGVVEI